MTAMKSVLLQSGMRIGAVVFNMKACRREYSAVRTEDGVRGWSGSSTTNVAANFGHPHPHDDRFVWYVHNRTRVSRAILFSASRSDIQDGKLEEEAEDEAVVDC